MQNDFVRDANPKPLYKAGNLKSIPDYIQDYALPMPEYLDGLASAAFADPTNRLHPIHEKAATILSGIYLHGTGKGSSKEMDNVKAAASVFGVEEDLDKVIAEFGETFNKQASESAPNIKYAMIVELEGGKQSNFYPISSEVQVRDSAVSLHNSLMNGTIPSDWAHHAAVKIVKSAKTLGINSNDIPARITQLGTERLVDIDHAKMAADLRRYDGVEEDGVHVYADIVKMAEEDPASVEECIKLWADLDMTHGIKYAKTFTPEEAFYAGELVDNIEKMASEVVLIKEIMVPSATFSRLSPELINSYFRKEAAQTIQEAVKLASENPADATCKLEGLDEENQTELLKLLIQA